MYYVVKSGGKSGIFDSESAALQAIDGKPNSFVKSFTSKKAAEDFLNGAEQQNEKVIDVYVDGSFDQVTQNYSYGAIFVKDGEKAHELSRVGNNPKYIESHQIAGEVFGALAAIKWALVHHYDAINVHYDYLGIEKWALGEWTAKKPVSKDYLLHFKKLVAQIKINFIKVKAHDGVEFNEQADKLARKVLETKN